MYLLEHSNSIYNSYVGNLLNLPYTYCIQGEFMLVLKQNLGERL